jgi:hypothetical protein
MKHLRSAINSVRKGHKNWWQTTDDAVVRFGPNSYQDSPICQLTPSLCVPCVSRSDGTVVLSGGAPARPLAVAAARASKRLVHAASARAGGARHGGERFQSCGYERRSIRYWSAACRVYGVGLGARKPTRGPARWEVAWWLTIGGVRCR